MRSDVKEIRDWVRSVRRLWCGAWKIGADYAGSTMYIGFRAVERRGVATIPTRQTSNRPQSGEPKARSTERRFERLRRLLRRFRKHLSEPS